MLLKENGLNLHTGVPHSHMRQISNKVLLSPLYFAEENCLEINEDLEVARSPI
jgi:hypothetical protein